MDIAVYTDGGLAGKNPSPLGGTWAYALVDIFDTPVKRGSGMLTPEDAGAESVSNNVTEWVAVVKGLEAAALLSPFSTALYTDSEVTVRRISKLRRRGRVKIKGLPDPWVQRMLRVVRSLGDLTVHLIGGHPSREELAAGRNKSGVKVSRHNVDCDRQCSYLANVMAGKIEPKDLQPSLS